MRRALGFLAIAAALAGCAAFWASAIPGDLQKNEECVASQIEGGDLDPVTIEAACLPGQLATIVQIIETLFTSQSFDVKHAAQLPTLRANVTTAKAAIAAGSAK
jgi:hypothetical protein